jgi:HD-GYP domain-containing protein (c-di-GMP phosphodiesterase class II)
MERRSLVLRAVGGVSLAVPAAAFIALHLAPAWDATLKASHPHFYIVSAVAGVAFLLSILVGVAALRTRDARTLMMALGFLSVSGVFLVHGLGSGDAALLHRAAQPAATTSPAAGHDDRSPGTHPTYAAPAVSRERQVNVAKGLQVSARLSLLLGGLFFALAVLDLPRRLAHALVRHARAVLLSGGAGVVIYLLVATRAPAIFAPIPVRSAPLSHGTAALTIAFLAFAGWRFWQAYNLARLPLQGAMALGMGFLIEAQWFMAVGVVWRLSWWLYHGAMLTGFLICVGALLAQYRLAGDLGAVVAGLFLRSTVGGLRRNDPRALMALSAAVAAKDGDTGAHLERVADLSGVIGARLGLAGDRLEALRWGGRLHDLGKIGVPDAVLNKPGPLTPDEFELIKQHCVRGDMVARRSGVLAAAAPAIRSHHERWDGTGYPDGLAGDAIPLEARIVAVADVYDALTSERSYKPAWSHDAALSRIQAEGGHAFDPDCVAALAAVVDRRRPQSLAS